MVLNIRQLRRQSTITTNGLELDLPLVPNSTIKYAGRDDLQVQVDSAATDVSSVGSTVASHATLHTQHAAAIVTHSSEITTERARLDTLMDSGTSLDQITELRAAWERGGTREN